MIQLPEKIKKDILESNLNLHPFIIIGWNSDVGIPKPHAVLVSTQQEEIISNNQDPDGYNPVYDSDLKISTLKESIDFETRSFKINNLTLTLSNYNNFSLLLSEMEIMNETVAVFWKTQSVIDLEDCLLVYEGQIVRYDHDEKKIKISLEDKSLFKIDKDVPIANLGTSSRVLNDKYVNQYIPMAYGKIPIAPAIIYALNSDELSHFEYEDNPFTGYYVIADDVFDSLSLDRQIGCRINNPNGLLINKGDYWNVTSEFPDVNSYSNFEFDFPVTREQTRLYPTPTELNPGSFAYFVPDTKLSTNIAYPGNPIANDTVFCTRDHYPNMFSIRSSEVTDEFNLSNPQYAIDRGHSDLEAQTFGLNPRDSVSYWPDIDRDSWEAPEINPYSSYDASNDLSEQLDNSRFGNFLQFEQNLGWNHCTIAQNHNWWFGTYYYWTVDVSAIFCGLLPTSPLVYRELEQAWNVSDDDWWGRHKKWSIEVNNYGNMAFNSYGTFVRVFGGVHEGSWACDWEHYTWDLYANEGQSDSIGANNATARPQYSSPSNWNNGTYDNTLAKKYLPRCWDLRNSHLTMIPYGSSNYASTFPDGWPDDHQYSQLYGEGNYPDSHEEWLEITANGGLDSGGIFMQVPSTDIIREALESYLSDVLNSGITVGFGDEDNPASRYSFVTYLDGLMHSRQHYNDNYSSIFNIDADMSSENHESVMKQFPNYPLMLQIISAKPQGTLAWVFGYDIQQVPNKNGIYNRYPTKFIVVTMDGSLDVQKWNWKSTFDDQYYENMQEITHVIALWDLINFDNSMCGFIHSSYPNLGSWWDGQPDSGGFGYGGSNVPNATGSMHGGEQRHTHQVGASMHSNNRTIDVTEFLGEPGGEHYQYINNTKLGGGVGRWFILVTKNGFAQQTGLVPGVLWSQYNNYETFSENNVTGDREYWGMGDPETEWTYALGEFAYMIPASQGYAQMSDQDFVWFDMKFPDVGADDILDDGFRSFVKFNFGVGCDYEMMNQQTNENPDLNWDNMALKFAFFATNGEATQSSNYTGSNNADGYYNYSQTITGTGGVSASNLIDYSQDNETYGNMINENGKLWFDNINEPNGPITWGNAFDNNDDVVGVCELSGVGRYFTTMYVGEAWDPWYNPGQYNHVSLGVNYYDTDGTYGDANAAAPELPFNFGFKQIYLHYTGIFKKFTDSNFYIENYEGRQEMMDGIAYGLIENPAHIIKDILEKELFYDGTFNNGEYTEAYNACQNWNLGFSVTKKTNAKKLIEELCAATPIYPRFRSRNEFGYITVKKLYYDADVNKEIKSRDVIKYRFSKSKIEKIASSVEVKFDYDYDTKEYRQTTGWHSCKDYLGDGDAGYINYETENSGYKLSYYNLGESRNIGGTMFLEDSDTAKTLEAKYVTNIGSARKYAKFYMMYNCNQHLIMRLELTLAYLDLEVGDVLRFDEMIGNVYAYGMDYTKSNILNGQQIYPYFMIESVTKKLDKVEISCVQLHNLTQTFYANKGDISRRGSSVEQEGNQPTDTDKHMLIEYLENKATTRYTADQIKSLDINRSNSVTYKDLAFWDEWIEIGEEVDDGDLPPEPPSDQPDQPYEPT